MAPPDFIREFLSYDPDTGAFRWMRHAGGRSRVGADAGSADRDGYLRINFLGVRYRAHRLAWWYVTGEWVDGIIDHRNLQPADNRFANLRKATRAMNAVNSPKVAGCSSAYKGVTWNKRHGKWQAQIQADGRPRYIGLFAKEEDAAAAYAAAAREAFGEFARLA